MEKPAPKPKTKEEILAEIARIEAYLRVIELEKQIQSPPKCDKCGTRDAVAGLCGMCHICSR